MNEPETGKREVLEAIAGIAQALERQQTLLQSIADQLAQHKPTPTETLPEWILNDLEKFFDRGQQNRIYAKMQQYYPKKGYSVPTGEHLRAKLLEWLEREQMPKGEKFKKRK